jgi:uncharacterized protein (TIGR02001 family)
MKLIKTALCAAAASVAMAGTAHAGAAMEMSVNAGATTEYVFRGLSQGGASGFGGIDFASDQFYVGGWASDVGFGPSAEFDLYAGWTPSFGGADLDLGVIYYGYLNDPNTYVDYQTGLGDSSIDADYVELYAAASVPVGMGSVSGSVYYSPDFFAEAGDAIYYELGFAMPWQDVEFSGAIGVQTLDDVQDPLFFEDSYTTWNIGFTVPVADNLGVDVRYIDISSDGNIIGNSNLAGVGFDGIVGTLTATFP